MSQAVIDLVNAKVLPEFPPHQKQIGIIEILNIATSIVSLFQQCPDLTTHFEQDAAKILDSLKHPTLFHKARLYLTIRRQCRKDNNQDQLHAIVNACLRAGQNATLEDVKTLCTAANAANRSPKLALSDS